MTRIVLDVGTTNTRIFVPDKGVFLSQPTVLVVDAAAGIDSPALNVAPPPVDEGVRGRLPNGVVGIRPIEDGLIADPCAVGVLLHQCIGAARSMSRTLGRPAVTLSVPGCADERERFGWHRALKHAGAAKISLVSKPLAAALAAGISATDTTGSLLFDIGGGSTEISIVAQGRLVQHAMLPVAGEAIDRAVIRHVHDTYKLHIGEQTAEAVKKQIGCGYGHAPSSVLRIVGKALADGIPRSVDACAAGVAAAIRTEVQRIMAGLRAELEKASPPLLADIIDRGVVLMGGGAMLPGLDQVIWEAAGLKAIICPEPSTCTIRGSLEARAAGMDVPLEGHRAGTWTSRWTRDRWRN